MPKVSDLIRHINSNYPVLDLTENLVKGVYFANTFDDIASVPAAIQSDRALALIGNTPKVYNAFEGSNFTASESWREIVTSPVDYPELLGVDLVDDQSGLLDRYQVILYDSVDNVFKKATLDSLFGGLGAFVAQNSNTSATIVNPVTGIAGDLNGDGVVGTQDLIKLLSYYDTTQGVDGTEVLNPSDITLTGNQSISVNYGPQNYNAGDKLYIQLGLSNVIESGSYPITMIAPGTVNVGDPDPTISDPEWGGAIQINNPVATGVTPATLDEVLPPIIIKSGFYSGVSNYGIYFLNFSFDESGLLDNFVFGATVRFYANTDNGVQQVGDDLDVSINTSIENVGGFVAGTVLVNNPTDITNESSIIYNEWAALSDNHEIESLRLYFYIIFDESTLPQVNSINSINFTSNAFGLEIDTEGI